MALLSRESFILALLVSLAIALELDSCSSCKSSGYDLPETRVLKHRQGTNRQVDGRRHPARQSVDPPNPCRNGAGFENPLYQITDFSLLRDASESKQDQPQFRLSDLANNYSLSCQYTQLDLDVLDVSNLECNPTELQGYPSAWCQYSRPANQVTVNQIWVCDPKNTSYPAVYFSNASATSTVPVTCANATNGLNCTLPDGAALPTVLGDFVKPTKNSSADDIAPSTVGSVLNPVPGNDTPCIGTSFSVPNWNVTTSDDTASSSNMTGRAFTITSLATSSSVRCVASLGDYTSNGALDCSSLLVAGSASSTTTEAYLDEGSGLLSVNQSWTCALPGGNSPISFSAYGSGVMQAGATNRIAGSLTQPIRLTPNIAPFSSQTPGCSTITESPLWKISNVTASQDWEDHFVTSTVTGQLDFVLTNNANGLVLQCEASGPELNNCTDSDHGKWFDCVVPGRNPLPNYPVVTQFQFNQTNHEININQTWYCDDDEEHPARFVATGTATLPMDCTWTATSPVWPSIPVEYPCPTVGIFGNEVQYLQSCAMTDASMHVPSESVSRDDLAPFSLRDLVPTGPSCTIASVLTPHWIVTGWESVIDWQQWQDSTDMITEVSYSMSNPAFDGTFTANSWSSQMTPYLPTTNPHTWYPCTGPAGVTDCQWQIDLGTGYIALNQSWRCDDKDPGHPVVFQAIGSTNFNTSCTYSYYTDYLSFIECVGTNTPAIFPTDINWITTPDQIS